MRRRLFRLTPIVLTVRGFALPHRPEKRNYKHVQWTTNRICCLSFRAHSYTLSCFASGPPLNGSPTDRFEWTLFLLSFSLLGDTRQKSRSQCALGRVLSRNPYRVNAIDGCSRFPIKYIIIYYINCKKKIKFYK